MHNDWILDVLSDLRSFAVTNGLAVLAEQLDDARLVAATELANMEGNVPATAFVNERGIGGNHFLRAAGTGA